MAQVIEDLVVITIALVIFGTGCGYGIIHIHDTVREMALKKIEKGLSPTEPFAQQLTGEKLPF